MSVFLLCFEIVIKRFSMANFCINVSSKCAVMQISTSFGFLTGIEALYVNIYNLIEKKDYVYELTGLSLAFRHRQY